jgi:anaerobic ribonucleoside-triphosphate reductase
MVTRDKAGRITLKCNHIFIENDTAKICKKCNKYIYKTEMYSRVVGYIRPVSNWNDSKFAEFNDRVKFDSTFGIGEKQTKLKV